MRAAILLSLFLITGAITMTATEDVDAQEKKPEIKSNDTPPEKPYKEWVTVKTWTADDKHFGNPHPNVPAYWPTDADGKPKKDKNGVVRIALAGPVIDSFTGPKSEVTDRAGKTWVIVSTAFKDVDTGAKYFSVAPRPEEKK